MNISKIVRQAKDKEKILPIFFGLILLNFKQPEVRYLDILVLVIMKFPFALVLPETIAVKLLLLTAMVIGLML